MKFLILGDGYTTKFLEKNLSSKGVVQKTSRQPKHSSIIHFQLEDSKTWDNLPECDCLFWTFPPQPDELVKLLLEKINHKIKKIIVIGSTGSYLISKEHQEVQEQHPLDEQSQRVLGERVIQEFGGIVVRASGIYGPDRNPLEWIRSGRVGLSPKYLNLIHVEDLAEALYCAFLNGTRGANYIASSKSPLPWTELIEKLSETFSLPEEIKEFSSKRSSKIINADQTREELAWTLKYPTLLEGVIKLNQAN